jgi:Neuraminidase (sialidase)
MVKDESARIFAAPKGDIFRLVQTDGDQTGGGGSLLLAAARPRDAWQTLLDIRPPDDNITLRDGDLAVGPAGEMALIYRWWRVTPRSKELRVARSDDGGQTWSQPATPVDGGSGTSFDPRIVWTGGKGLVVTWSDERRGRRLFDVYARRSADGGVTWEPEQLLSRFPRNGPTDLYTAPQVLSDGGNRLWAIWMGLRGTKSAVYLNRSLDGGRTWTDPVPVTGESRSVFGQTIRQVGDHMLLVWNDTPIGQPDRVYAASSSDGGATWTAPTRIDRLAPEAPAASSLTAVLSPDGEALVAWQDARNSRDDIFMARSTDWGRTWSEEQRMDMDEPGTALSRFAKLARAADGRIALAWEDDRAGRESVYVRIRSAGPKPVWGPELLVVPTTSRAGARVPDIAWGAAGLYVSWQIWDQSSNAVRIEKRSATRVLSPDKQEK